MNKEVLNLLEVHDLKVERAGSLLVDIPFLTIQRGELVSLIGPNGAGKTTLLLTLACLLNPTRGQIFFRGRRIGSDYSVLEYRRNLAMVFQEPLLFNTTVFNNVASGLRIRRMEEREIRRRVNESLERFGIGHLGERSARTLSGGEAQRTSLARAFAIRPEILFLDEPFVSLDPPSRESLTEDLQAVLQETRTTAVLATHDRLEALRLSERLGVMKGGKIQQIDIPEEVMNHPTNEFVASFVGVETVLNGKVVRKNKGSFAALVAHHEIEAVGDVRVGENVALCIRPENVILSPPSRREMTSARNVFHGRIVRITPFGFFQRVQLDCGFPLVAYVTRHSMEDLSLTEGKEIQASFKATAIHVMKRRAK